MLKQVRITLLIPVLLTVLACQPQSDGGGNNAPAAAPAPKPEFHKMVSKLDGARTVFQGSILDLKKVIENFEPGTAFSFHTGGNLVKWKNLTEQKLLFKKEGNVVIEVQGPQSPTFYLEFNIIFRDFSVGADSEVGDPIELPPSLIL